MPSILRCTSNVLGINNHAIKIPVKGVNDLTAREVLGRNQIFLPFYFGVRGLMAKDALECPKQCRGMLCM